MLLRDLLTPDRMEAALPGPGAWQPYPAMSDRAAWAQVSDDVRAEVLPVAERMSAQQWPVLRASSFARFVRDGDRSEHEEPYFERRSRLAAFVLAAGLTGDEAWIDHVTDGIWLICEETTWCTPGHRYGRYAGTPFAEPGEHSLDLFAAETGAALAWADLVIGERLDPTVRARVRDEVRRRVLVPYRNDARERFWFAKLPSNWNTWIHSNVLACTLMLDGSRGDLVETVVQTVEGLDNFLAAYPADGGCGEGIAYWWRAGGSLAECLDTLWSASDGELDGFAVPVVREIARFPLYMHIGGPWYVNFGDGGPRVGDSYSAALLYRFGARLADTQICAHARAMRAADPPLIRRITSLGRTLAGIFDHAWSAAGDAEFPLLGESWLPDSEVFTARETPGSTEGIFVAVKGGHNGENHNHNDVGNVVVAIDGQPVLVDAGVGQYKRQTFQAATRYTIWTMQSSFHNVPEVDGVAQQAGPQFRATDVHRSPGKVSLDVAAAYPPEAGISSWRRSVSMTQEGLLIVDAWHLDHRPSSVVLHFLTANEPEGTIGPGRLGLPGSAYLQFDAAEFDVEVVPIDLDDHKLVRVWGERLYRIILVATRPAPTGESRLVVNTAAHADTRG